MAWTTPRTWVDGELVTASIMNAHVRDNLNVAYPHLIARKTADQSVTSSATLVDCTTMVLPVVANEIYRIEFNIIYSAGTAGDLKVAFTFPAAGRIDASVVWTNETSTTAIQSWSGTTTPTTSVLLLGGGGTTRYSLPIQGIFTNAGTGGNLTLQFAQATSDGTATTIHANSTVWAVKLA